MTRWSIPTISGKGWGFTSRFTKTDFLVLKFFLKLFLVLAVLRLHCCAGLSLVAVRRLLIVVASLVAEHGL